MPLLIYVYDGSNYRLCNEVHRSYSCISSELCCCQVHWHSLLWWGGEWCATGLAGLVKVKTQTLAYIWVSWSMAMWQQLRSHTYSQWTAFHVEREPAGSFFSAEKWGLWQVKVAHQDCGGYMLGRSWNGWFPVKRVPKNRHTGTRHTGWELPYIHGKPSHGKNKGRNLCT